MFALLLGVLVTLLLTVSPLALQAFGIGYEDAGGGPLEKIHPATMLAAAIVLFAAIAARNPLQFALRQAAADHSLLPFLGVIGLLVVHSIRFVQLPFTHLIDTFILPVLIFLLFKHPSEPRGRNLAWLIHALMAANAIVGIGEIATGLRLTPLVAAGVVIDDDWRATALLGHPLANSALTGSYLLMLTLGGARDLPKPLALGAFLLGSAAMISFGGRAASVLLVAFIAANAGLRLLAILRGEGFSKIAVLKFLLVVPVACIAIAVLAEAGVFDQFIERFFDDKGSAETRAEMFELFRYVPLDELLLAPDADQIASLQQMHGLEFGIESFWIAYIFMYGVLPSLVFFAALGWFTYDVLRYTRRGASAAVLYFYGVASTSVSLSAKSPVLGIFTMMLLVLLRSVRTEGPDADDVDRRTARASSRHMAAHRMSMPPGMAIASGPQSDDARGNAASYRDRDPCA